MSIVKIIGISIIFLFLGFVIEHGHMEFSYLNRKEESMENYYIVYTWGSGKNMFSDFDLRGH